MILLIGMAVGVDYSLFYLRREREERRARVRTPTPRSQAAAATSGRSVLVSGLHRDDGDGRACTSTGDKTFESYATGGILVVGVAVPRVADRAAGDARRSSATR